MNTTQNTGKRAVCVMLEPEQINSLEELKEVLVRSTITDVVRFLIVDASKKFLDKNCPMGQTTKTTRRATAAK